MLLDFFQDQDDPCTLAEQRPPLEDQLLREFLAHLKRKTHGHKDGKPVFDLLIFDPLLEQFSVLHTDEELKKPVLSHHHRVSSREGFVIGSRGISKRSQNLKKFVQGLNALEMLTSLYKTFKDSPLPFGAKRISKVSPPVATLPLTTFSPKCRFRKIRTRLARRPLDHFGKPERIDQPVFSG